MGSLQKLSLYSRMYWGFYPHVKLDGIHFPNLKSLTLGNFSFYEDKQLDWITSHSTLQELYLNNCPILFHIVMNDSEQELSRCPKDKSGMQRNGDWKLEHHYPRRWYDYFVAIEKGLPHLHHFRFGINPEWDKFVLPFEREMDIVPALEKDRYMGFHGGIGDLGPEYLRPTCDEEDRKALMALHRKIGQQIDCGTFSLGGYTVKNLIQTKDISGY